MRVLLIILGIILLLVGAGLAVLSHPAFGLWRQVSKARIKASPNYRDGMFQNQEPTPQFTGDTASTSCTLWRFLTDKDTLRVPQQPIPAVKTDLKNLPTDSDWLVEQKKAGRIRNLGFSYHGDIKIFDMLLRWHDEGKYHWDFVQIQLNLLDWNHAKVQKARNTNASYLYAELEKRGIPSVIMEPLLGGRLAKQPPQILRTMKQMDIDATPAEWALRFAGTPPTILTVLSGMTYMEHLQENCNTYSPLRPITEQENAMLMKIADDICRMNAIPCTACNYCMPCPYGIDIPNIFGYYNICLSEELLSTDNNNDSAFRKARKKWLVGYDKNVERMRQADHCIGCNKCLSHCPQRINIPQEMQKIDALVESLKQ